MASGRGPVIAWSGTLAGLGIAAATLIATVGKKPVSNLWFILSVAVAAVAAVIFVAAGLPDLFSWLSGGLRSIRQALHRSDRLITDRWQYTADGAKAPAAMSATELALPGTGYMIQPGDRLSWARFVVLIACSQIGSDADSQLLWPKFQKFLKQPPVTSLINSLSSGVRGLLWTRWATNSAGTIDAVLTPGEESDAVASARLELPDGTSRHFRDQRYAMLILHFEPPSKTCSAVPPAGPVAWTDHILRALELPLALATFLSGPLALTTSGQPPATLGFRLEAQRDMAEMIDITGLSQLRGGHHTSQAIGYFIANPQGVFAADAANRMITDVLRYALKAER